jgi:hypothetical protein
MQRLLAAAAGEWEGAGRERSYLLRGARLTQFDGWAEGSAVALTPDELVYLDASLEERQQRRAAAKARQERERSLERRARRVLRGLVGVFLAAALVSGGLAIWANAQRKRAEAAEHDALVQASVGLASQAMLELEGSSPERSVLLALEALENYPYTYQAERALGQAVLDDPEVRARVWDAASGEPLVALVGHSGDVWWAGWSPDGTRIVTGGAGDATARLWDADTGAELLRFTGHGAGVTSVAWSPGGKTIASSSFDGTAKMWDAKTGEVIRDLYPEGHAISVFALSWAPEGDRIATFAQDGTGIVWDITNGEELATLTGHVGNVATVQWSRRGDRIFTSSSDRTVRVWDATTGAELLRYDVEGSVEAALSPDETRIAMSMGLPGLLKVLPAWQTQDELMDHARECCVVRELTDAEREMLGLPAR